MEIKDSGARRQFQSGAVRDISNDKGDMSLLPFDVVGDFAEYYEANKEADRDYFQMSTMMHLAEQFRETSQPKYICEMLISFINRYFNGSIESAIIAYSQQLQGGSLKYKKYNWMLGLPTHCFLDSGLRHGTKVLRGDNDEPHDKAFIWNFMGLLWTLKHRPELDDIFHGDKFDKTTIDDYHEKWR